MEKLSDLSHLLVVVGPTASGKSSFALELAKKYGGEIVNADSRQMYKGVSIGVAKPDFDDVVGDVGFVDGISHHLYFMLDPLERGSVVRFQKTAFVVIDEILRRGKVPILVGGTGYYVQAVVDNMQYPDVELNDEREALQNVSLDEMVKELREYDAFICEKIDCKNPRRVMNALLRKRKSAPDVEKGGMLYDVLMYGMEVDRETLKKRIAVRVDAMLEAGLGAEVQRILDMYGADAPVLDSIGYKEVVAYIQGNIDALEMREQIIIHTQQYARRQMQWLKRDKRIEWVKLG